MDNDIIDNDVGVKTCQLNVRVYNALSLCISAPLSEAGCSKNSDKGLSIRSPPKPAYIRVCIASKAASVLLLARYGTGQHHRKWYYIKIKKL